MKPFADVVGHDVGDAGSDERELDDERVEVGSRTQEPLAEDLAVELAAPGLLELDLLDLFDEVVGQGPVVILNFSQMTISGLRTFIICISIS